MADFERRLPSIERAVAEIRAEDGRVRVLGRVVDASDGRLVIDDGTGSVVTSFAELPKWLAPGAQVRVFGRVMAAENGVELEGELVQDMRMLDASLLKRVQAAERKASSITA